MQYTIEINGAHHSVDIDGETPLLWVLRDVLDLKGTKFGCGAAQCGACTVHLGGQPVRSCQIPIAAVGGGDSFPPRKPDPAHLLSTIAQAGGDPQRAIMAGDHANDIAAAQGAGLPSIFALWGYGPETMARGAAASARRFTELAVIAPRLLP